MPGIGLQMLGIGLQMLGMKRFWPWRKLPGRAASIFRVAQPPKTVI
jgi:hypothetical protein